MWFIAAVCVIIVGYLNDVTTQCGVAAATVRCMYCANRFRRDVIQILFHVIMCVIIMTTKLKQGEASSLFVQLIV